MQTFDIRSSTPIRRLPVLRTEVMATNSKDAHTRHLPSDFWTGFDSWQGDPDHWVGERVSRFLGDLDTHALQQICTATRKGIACTISDRFACGTENVLKEIVYEDGVVWVARLAIKRQPPEVIRSEVTTMRYIKEHTTIPIPQVMGYDDSADNSASCQYILMEGIYGRPYTEPGAHHLFHLPDNKVGAVFAQLADILVQLSSLRFPEIGSLNIDENGQLYIGDVYGTSLRGRFKKCSTPLQYFQSIITNSVNRAESMDDNRKAAILSTAKLKTQLASRFLSHADTYPLTHPDFQAQNVLFDDEFRIVGVIDWSYAHTVPVECMCCVPGGGYILPEFQINAISPAWKDRVMYLQSVRLRFRNALCQELRAAEDEKLLISRGNQDTIMEEPPLSHIFETASARHATIFAEFYYPQDREIIDLLEDKLLICY